MWARVDQRRGTDVVWCALYVAWLQGDWPQFYNGGTGNARQMAMGQMAMGQMANGLAAAARGRITPTDGSKARPSHP